MFENRLKWSFLAPLLVGMIPRPAHAHLVSSDAGEFYAGMLHPVTSAEHVLPMIVLAFLAGRCGKTAARLAILAFPVALVVGIAAGSRFPAVGFFHTANLILIAAMGLLLILAPRLNPKSSVVCAAAAGIVLGWRSGGDWAVSNVGILFVPGAALTGFLVIALIASCVPQRADRRDEILRWAVGGGFVVAGIVMLSRLLAGGDAAGGIVAMPTEEGLKALLTSPELTPAFFFSALLAAAAWGAAHALSPGHGKAVVGAYLVGARGTPWHALYLGLTVTVTHTFGVFLLGLAATFAAGLVEPETIYPWLGVASGLLVLLVGATMFYRRIKPLLANQREHTHDHDHVHDHHHHHGHSPVQLHAHDQAEKPHLHHHHSVHPPDEVDSHPHGHHRHGRRTHSHLPPGMDGAPVTWRSLLALGVSGGMLPCPSAMVLLLGAATLHRIWFGLALVAAFSFGLAAVLTVVGFLFIKGSRLVEGSGTVAAVGPWLPTASAFAVCILGGWIVWSAAFQIVTR